MWIGKRLGGLPLAGAFRGIHSPTIQNVMRLRTVALILLALACSDATPAFAKHEISKQTRELFEWFDKLGFEDTSHAKFIRVRTGDGMVDGDEKAFDECDGFLLEDRGATFRAVLSDLTVGTFTKAGTDRTDPAYCGYRELSIEAQGRTVLRELRTGMGNPGPYHQTFDRLSMPGQSFVLARECERRGFGDLADRLVLAMVDRLGSGDGTAKWGQFTNQLHQDFAEAMRWRADIALGDSARTWASLADGYRRIVEMCPETGVATEAAVMLGKIERLAAEEAAHARVAPVSLDGLPAAERARELVWRLREEQDLARDQGDTWGRPWPHAPRQSNGAMEDLRQLGLDAVPALVAELRGEERLCRSISRSTTNGNRIRMSTTAGFASRILDDISGLSFLSLVRSNSEKSGREALADEVEEWHAALRARGEEAWLVDTVRSGGTRAVICAPRLLEKYPDSFVGAALSGWLLTLNSFDHDTCDRLLALLAPYRDPVVETVLQDQFKAASEYHDRLAIAYFLRRWGYAAADEMIRADWAELAGEGFAEERQNSRIGNPPQRFPEQLGTDRPADDLRYLAMSDSPENLRLVLATWPKVPMRLRVPLILSMAYGGVTSPFETEVPNSPVFRAFSQETLLATLEDVTELADFSLPTEEGVVYWPRLCDLAAAALHVRWPEKYPFDLHAPESVRDRQRLAMLNAWRRESGLAELALPPVRVRLPAARWNHVAAVEWEEGSVAPSPDLRRQFATWCNRPLQADALVSAVTAYAIRPQAGTNSLRIAIHRDGDGTGIVVRLRLQKGDPDANGAAGIKQLAVAGPNGFHSTACNGSRTSLGGKESWSPFGTNAVLALQQPAQVPVVIEAEMALLELR